MSLCMIVDRELFEYFVASTGWLPNFQYANYAALIKSKYAISKHIL